MDPKSKLFGMNLVSIEIASIHVFFIDELSLTVLTVLIIFHDKQLDKYTEI